MEDSLPVAYSHVSVRICIHILQVSPILLFHLSSFLLSIHPSFDPLFRLDLSLPSRVLLPSQSAQTTEFRVIPINLYSQTFFCVIYATRVNLVLRLYGQINLLRPNYQRVTCMRNYLRQTALILTQVMEATQSKDFLLKRNTTCNKKRKTRNFL